MINSNKKGSERLPEFQKYLLDRILSLKTKLLIGSNAILLMPKNKKLP